MELNAWFSIAWLPQWVSMDWWIFLRTKPCHFNLKYHWNSLQFHTFQHFISSKLSLESTRFISPTCLSDGSIWAGAGDWHGNGRFLMSRRFSHKNLYLYGISKWHVSLPEGMYTIVYPMFRQKIVGHPCPYSEQDSFQESKINMGSTRNL